MNENSSGNVDSSAELPQDTGNSPAGTAGKIPQGTISILKGAAGSEGAASPRGLGKEDADVSRHQILPPGCQDVVMGGTNPAAGSGVPLWQILCHPQLPTSCLQLAHAA